MNSFSPTIQAPNHLLAIWPGIRAEARQASIAEPGLASFYYCTILNHASFQDAITYTLASLLAGPDLSAMLVREVCQEALAEQPGLEVQMLRDIYAWYDRDAACDQYMVPLLHFKGFHALQSHRISHWLWQQGREALALFFQNRISERFGVDIHPAAQMGSGIMIDHATGVVIGETAIVHDDVSMLHSITLGGSGCQSVKRHPTIHKGVLMGAGCKILGNVDVGENAKVAAGSVVIEAVPSGVTVAGVPAKIVGRGRTTKPAESMDQCLPD
ncbi:serine O-acetyltransferase [Halioxenophilus sp. WMMB6]|uniref:serine O-acetyltransferase n=1 Tax=Halioxenophilus sp. WMMB6 TaxID=3073815 RepID=UPI00295E64DC|nr:serine O-acetyltransferase [Halioxenophilus sp. WMMB6]